MKRRIIFCRTAAGQLQGDALWRNSFRDEISRAEMYRDDYLNRRKP